ncbi:hypothetical protein [Streptomyces anulatus]|uniref:hypothetical protein n=1 Tax=Streptomyces anulatus TaxID=1892 RepID=UPI00215197C3|nr:hypothetical protein [Streptomyces anulatus]
MRDKSGNQHVLSISTLRRIILRITTPVDEQQFLAIVHGCGITDQDELWSAAWKKVTATTAVTDERSATRTPPASWTGPLPDELSHVQIKRFNYPLPRHEYDRLSLLLGPPPQRKSDFRSVSRRLLDDLREQYHLHTRRGGDGGMYLMPF